MSKGHDGSVKMPKTIKAGCGVCFDPDDLSEDTGFDFTGAAEWLKRREQTGTEPSDTGSHPDNNEDMSPDPGSDDTPEDID